MKKRKKKTDRQKIMGKLDSLVSRITRNLNPTCEWCGKRPSAHAHHIFSRRYMATRHDLTNLIALCAGCHMRIHQYPEEGRDFMIEDRPDKFLDVKKRAKFGSKVYTHELEEIYAYFSEKYNLK